MNGTRSYTASRPPHGLLGLATWLTSDSERCTAAVSHTQSSDTFWTALVRTARTEGLAGLVLEAAAKQAIELPPMLAEALTQQARSTRTENLGMLRDLSRLLEAFCDAGLPVLLLKGAALNLSLYDDACLRPMTDLDLMIRRRDAEAACRLLERLGCRPGRPHVRPDLFPQYYYETEYLATFARPVRIDLHVRPLRPLRTACTVSENEFWDATIEVRCGAATARVSDSEALFVHLAAHASFHGCSRLIWLYDLWRLVAQRQHAINWGKVAMLCDRWRLSLPVLTAVERAAGLFGAFIPPEITEELRRHRNSLGDRLALRQAPQDASAPVRHLAVSLLCTPDWRLGAGYVLAHVLPGEAHLAEFYPHRHRAWTWCAHARRFVRSIARLVAAPAA